MQLGNTPKKGGDDKPREIPPAGTHLGFLFRIVDGGWCLSEYQGEKKLRTESRLDFEIWPMDDKGQYVTMSDGKPFAVAPGFMGWLTMKKLGDVLTSWKGSPTCDTEQILGQPAFITIVHKQYTSKRTGKQEIAVDVTGVSPLPEMLLKTMHMPDMVNPPLVYSVREHDLDLFLKLPKWIQKHIIDKSDDWAKLPVTVKPAPEGVEAGDDPGPSAPTGAPTDSDIPF